MPITLSKTFRFEAAHRLPRVPAGHKCGRLHGHSYQIDVIVSGDVDPDTGMVIDFAEIARAWQPLHDVLDHYYLNEIEGLENPTSEILAEWIYRRIKPNLPCLSAIYVHETCTSSARYEE
ncbi:MAG: 6-carboxytetrahydropterin synthase QueD [Proteobacteria bacterium]|nr:6-carboxytetrahydropterin synthase QueD [Pseudomonadota bacterium]MBQ9244479.1 6-carboxytetrahydropterin synthase QueD [Pseudomonadota bacterium]